MLTQIIEHYLKRLILQIFHSKYGYVLICFFLKTGLFPCIIQKILVSLGFYRIHNSIRCSQYDIAAFKLSLYQRSQNISYPELIQRIEKLSKEDRPKAIEFYTMFSPETALKLYGDLQIDSPIYTSLLIHFNKITEHSVIMEFFNKQTKKSKNLELNLYNYYLSQGLAAKAIDAFNQYLFSKDLYPIKRVDTTEDLYITNIMNSTSKACLHCEEKVSILITAYNEKNLILKSLQSIESQTYSNIEIIAIDDGSIDRTFQILLDFQATSICQIKLIRMKKNYGTYIAKNVGLYYATGDLITFHDSDDWAHPQRIEKHVYEHRKGATASISKLVRIKPNGQLFSKTIFPIDRLSMISLMIRRDVLEELGFFKISRIGNDSEYFERIKLYYGQKNVITIDSVLNICAYRKGSLTTDTNTGISGYGVNIKRLQHWQRFRIMHMNVIIKRKSLYNHFDISRYSYEVYF